MTTRFTPRGADDPTVMIPIRLHPAARVAAAAVVLGTVAAMLSVLLWFVALDVVAWRAMFG